MVLQLKLRKVGNSVVLVLPKEALIHLNVAEGDMVCVTEVADGSLRLSSADSEFTRQKEAAAKIVRRYRNTLRELAK